LMVGIGGIVGFRTGLWMLIGAILGWLVIAPPLIDQNVIRMTVKERLLDLPTSVREHLKREPAGYLKYRPDGATLDFAGMMSAAERDRYLGLSDDPAYQDAIRRIFVRSQLRLGAPLAAVPVGVKIDLLPVAFDPERQLLKPSRPLGRDDLANLEA